MRLYRFEVTTTSGSFPVVAAADDEEAAFEAAHGEVERRFLRLPEIVDIALYEKKGVGAKGSAFVLNHEPSPSKDREG